MKKFDYWFQTDDDKSLLFHSKVNCLIVDGTVAVVHLGPYRLEPVSMASCDHAIVALDFANGNQLEDLWQLIPTSRNVEWSLFNIKDKLFRLDESAGHFKMEQVYWFLNF